MNTVLTVLVFQLGDCGGFDWKVKEMKSIRFEENDIRYRKVEIRKALAVFLDWSGCAQKEQKIV